MIADLLREVTDTRVDVASARFSVQRLPPVLAKPGGERRPSVVDVVRHAFRIGATGIML